MSSMNSTLFESLSGKMRSTSAEIIGEVWTYYFCRSEAVSRGVKEGALCNKPNKEVIDRSTGSFLPAKREAGSLAMASFSLLLCDVCSPGSEFL